MKYTYKPMTIEFANEIVKWKYSGYMKEIYMEPYFTNFETTGVMKGPGNCDGFVSLLNDELAGLFEFYIKEDYIEIGLALAPKFVGKGYSKEFIIQGIEFGVKHYKYDKDFIVLNVEHGNVAAYKAYLKAGFKEQGKNEEEIEMRYYL